MKKIFSNFMQYFVDVLLAGILLVYLINIALFSQENPQYNCYVLVLIWILAYYVMYRIITKFFKKKDIYIKLGIVIVSLLIYSVWNLIARTAPVSDYRVLVDGAHSVIDGNFANLAFDKTNYFYFYNFQTGFVMWLALIMKITGGSLMGLKIAEIIILACVNLLVYVVVSKIAKSKEIGLMSVLVYGTLLFNIAGSSIINNQHVAILFILLAIYFLIMEKKNVLSKILAGIFLGIAIIIRPSSIIFLLGIICYYVWILLNRIGLNVKTTILSVMVVVVAALGLIKIVDFTLMNVGLVPNPISISNVTNFKYVLGIQSAGITGKTTTDAEHTQVFYDLEEYEFNYEEYNKASEEYLKNRYKSETMSVISHIRNKMSIFMAHPDNQINFAVKDSERKAVRMVRIFGYAQYVMLVVVSLGFVVYKIRDKKLVEKHDNNYLVLLKIVFIGFFLIHILIEVQTRYRYDQYLILSILTAYGLYTLYEWYMKNKRICSKKSNIKV